MRREVARCFKGNRAASFQPQDAARTQHSHLFDYRLPSLEIHPTIARLSMNYFGFHLVFNLPVLAVLGFLAKKNGFGGSDGIAMLCVLLVSVVFAAFWDTHAIRSGIWSFPKGKVSARIGVIPVEEYLFFIVQSVQAVLLVHVFERMFGPMAPPRFTGAGPITTVAAVLIALFSILAAHRSSHRFGAGTRFHYAYHLASWFVPMLLLQWLLAWQLLLPHILPILASTALLSFYLSVADVAAIQERIWVLDEKQITGHKILGVLAWEEVAFFVIANLVLTQTYFMFLAAFAR
jgi:lycopene cyclase domain-containing protein